jgi:hypothetical protein
MAHGFWRQITDAGPLRTLIAVLSSLPGVSGIDPDLGDIVETTVGTFTAFTVHRAFGPHVRSSC